MLPSLELVSIVSRMQRQTAMLFSNVPFREPWVWFLPYQKYLMVRATLSDPVLLSHQALGPIHW